jgi:hypothetical protein
MDYKLGLYQPAEIDIGGQKYKFKSLNKPRFRKLREYEKKIEETADGFERMELMYEQVYSAVDAPHEILDELDVSQLNELISIIGKVAAERKPSVETPEETEEKNGLKPGDVTAP